MVDVKRGLDLSPLERAQAHDLCTALRRAAQDHAPARLARLYEVMLSASPHIGDTVLERLQRSGADPARMATLARWLAYKAPDIIAVRFAIALLGQYGSAADTDLMMTLGRHEEFTLSCALAVCKLLGPEPSQTAMWNLARRVQGWGRIHVVGRLATTGCPEVQQWLLREGYKNTVDSECLAHACAGGGRLLAALQGAQVDERLLIGAGDLLQALLHGNFHDYHDGEAALLAYMQCVHRMRPRQPQVAAAVMEIAARARTAVIWDDARLRQVLALADQILLFDYWQAAPGAQRLTG